MALPPNVECLSFSATRMASPPARLIGQRDRPVLICLWPSYIHTYGLLDYNACHWRASLVLDLDQYIAVFAGVILIHGSMFDSRLPPLLQTVLSHLLEQHVLSEWTLHSFAEIKELRIRFRPHSYNVRNAEGGGLGVSARTDTQLALPMPEDLPSGGYVIGGAPEVREILPSDKCSTEGTSGAELSRSRLVRQTSLEVHHGQTGVFVDQATDVTESGSRELLLAKKREPSDDAPFESPGSFQFSVADSDPSLPHPIYDIREESPSEVAQLEAKDNDTQRQMASRPAQLVTVQQDSLEFSSGASWDESLTPDEYSLHTEKVLEGPGTCRLDCLPRPMSLDTQTGSDSAASSPGMPGSAEQEMLSRSLPAVLAGKLLDPIFSSGYDNDNANVNITAQRALDTVSLLREQNKNKKLTGQQHIDTDPLPVATRKRLNPCEYFVKIVNDFTNRQSNVALRALSHDGQIIVYDYHNPTEKENFHVYTLTGPECDQNYKDNLAIIQRLADRRTTKDWGNHIQTLCRRWVDRYQPSDWFVKFYLCSTHVCISKIYKCVSMNESFELLIEISSMFLWVHFTISQDWLKQWLGTKQATSFYLNQRCLSSGLNVIN